MLGLGSQRSAIATSRGQVTLAGCVALANAAMCRACDGEYAKRFVAEQRMPHPQAESCFPFAHF